VGATRLWGKQLESRGVGAVVAEVDVVLVWRRCCVERRNRTGFDLVVLDNYPVEVRRIRIGLRFRAVVDAFRFKRQAGVPTIWGAKAEVRRGNKANLSGWITEASEHAVLDCLTVAGNYVPNEPSIAEVLVGRTDHLIGTVVRIGQWFRASVQGDD